MEVFRLKALRDKRLVEACKKGNLKKVKKLIGKIHANEEKALIWAADFGYLEVVKYLVEKGADVHILDDMPLRRAAAGGHLEIIKYLIENGANIHAGDDEALRWLVGDGPLDAIEYLVSKGANVRVIKLEELASDRNILNILLKGLSTQELMPFLVSNSNSIRELAKRVLERRQKLVI